jgi:hypothetical protein
VPQDLAAAAGRAIPEALAPGTLPKSVQDAMHGQRLRINDLSEVQVYILGDELGPEGRRLPRWCHDQDRGRAAPPRAGPDSASGLRRSRSCPLSITSGSRTTRFVAPARR